MTNTKEDTELRKYFEVTFREGGHWFGVKPTVTTFLEICRNHKIDGLEVTALRFRIAENAWFVLDFVDFKPHGVKFYLQENH